MYERVYPALSGICAFPASWFASPHESHRVYISLHQLSQNSHTIIETGFIGDKATFSVGGSREPRRRLMPSNEKITSRTERALRSQIFLLTVLSGTLNRRLILSRWSVRVRCMFHARNMSWGAQFGRIVTDGATDGRKQHMDDANGRSKTTYGRCKRTVENNIWTVQTDGRKQHMDGANGRSKTTYGRCKRTVENNIWTVQTDGRKQHIYCCIFKVNRPYVSSGY